MPATVQQRPSRAGRDARRAPVGGSHQYPLAAAGHIVQIRPRRVLVGRGQRALGPEARQSCHGHRQPKYDLHRAATAGPAISFAQGRGIPALCRARWALGFLYRARAVCVCWPSAGPRERLLPYSLVRGEGGRPGFSGAGSGRSRRRNARSPELDAPPPSVGPRLTGSCLNLSRRPRAAPARPAPARRPARRSARTPNRDRPAGRRAARRRRPLPPVLRVLRRGR